MYIHYPSFLLVFMVIECIRNFSMRKMRNSLQSQLAGGEKACSASLVEKDERVEKVEKDES